MKILDDNILQSISAQASCNQRLRQNFNLHDRFDEPSQRMLNAIEPGSYLRPHRHLADPKPEGFIAVRGRLALLTFDDRGMVEQIVQFGPNLSVFGLDLPSGLWHTIVSLKKGSVIYETKRGPYQAIDQSDLAPWAPEEGSLKAGEYLARLHEIIAGGIEKPA